MTKAIHDGRICIVFETIEEARNWLTALSSVVPFYTTHKGVVYEIRNLRDVSITLVASADIRELRNEVKKEGVVG